MTYFYDDYVEQYGKTTPDKIWPRGTYITPEGTLFDVDTHASVSHAGGFVIPFFTHYITPEKDMRYFSKDEYLNSLINWEKALTTKTYDVKLKEQKMRLYLVRYLINVYRSKHGIWDLENEIVDFSQVTGILDTNRNLFGRDRLLKDILVQACNYDAIESQLYRTITTSKFNIYETFYDYILHDYKIYQIPKKVYDVQSEKYINWEQNSFMVADKELRLKEELESICSNVPLEERKAYCRSKVKINRYDYAN